MLTLKHTSSRLLSTAALLRGSPPPFAAANASSSPASQCLFSPCFGCRVSGFKFRV